jgi:hypothetical protein
MSYIAPRPESYVDQVVGNGQCVAYVKEASRAPASSLWRAGTKVIDTTDLARGTAIATFDDNGLYPNHPSGNHAAILERQEGSSIVVWDQWTGQPVHQRTIRDMPDSSNWSNDSSRFSVIEGSKELSAFRNLDSAPQSCRQISALPANSFGRIGLPLGMSEWAAVCISRGYSGNVEPSSLVQDPVMPFAGLGNFWDLEILFSSRADHPLAEVTLTLVSLAGPNLKYEVYDLDDQMIQSESLHYPPRIPFSVAIRAPGIFRIRVLEVPERILDTVCVRLL